MLFEFSAGNGAGVRAGLRSSLHSLRIHLNCHLEILVCLCHLLLQWFRERESQNYESSYNRTALCKSEFTLGSMAFQILNLYAPATIIIITEHYTIAL